MFLSAIMDWVYKKFNNWIFNKLIIKTQKKIDDLLECEIMMKQLNKTMETAQKLILLYKSMIIK